jgi:hypothetical protein
MSHGVKLLLTAMSNAGKTTALSKLNPETSLVINIDGKSFSHAIPHANFDSFPSVDSLINGWHDGDAYQDGIVDKVNKFVEVTGDMPATIAFDTISRAIMIIADNANNSHKGFEIYTQISKEVAKLMEFLQVGIVNEGMNVVITSHVIQEADGLWIDASVGSFKKAGGVLSTVDNSVFLSIENKKYKASHRVPGLPCRTLLKEDVLPSTQKADDYDIQKHLNLLQEFMTEATKFVI